MAKTRDEIKELLSADLFKRGIANNYITINNDGSYITYHRKNNTRRKLCNPEEFVILGTISLNSYLTYFNSLMITL